MSSLGVDFQNHVSSVFPELKEGKSVLALSGGIDSMVLCHLLLETGIRFSTAHCNFQLRGSESEDDERFVTEKSRELGLKIHLRRFDTEQFASHNRLSIQMAARQLRYAWFDEVLIPAEADFILTAHHADDNLETFLINLSRGSGLKGLTGIPERTGKIIRPLLPFSREEILSFALENGIQWRDDESNSENKYLRNRIRHELVPVLKEIFPSFLLNFKKTLGHLEEALVISEERILQVWEEVTEIKGTEIRIDIAKMASYGNPGAYLYGLLNRFGFSQWEDIEQLLSSQSGKMVFSKTHRLLKDRAHLLLQRLDTLPDSESQHLVLKGQQVLRFSSGTLTLKEFSFSAEGLKDRSQCSGKEVVCIDSDLLIFPLRVRKWQNGDYFYPKGMKGSKKLSKFFKDEKLSVAEKENIWLLCSGNEVVWIVGMRSDERFKITEDTKNVLQIEYKIK